MLILAVAVALVALYFFYTAAQALLGPPLPARGLGEDAGMGLIIKRDFLIEALRDLELEAALDKLSEADLAQLKARYEVEAISIIEALEAREGAYAARIEADLKRRVEALGEGGAGQPQQPEQIKAQQPKPQHKGKKGNKGNHSGRSVQPKQPEQPEQPEQPQQPKPEPEQPKPEQPKPEQPKAPAAQVNAEVNAEVNMEVNAEVNMEGEAGYRCPACQAAVEPKARFCDECGAPTRRCPACQAPNRAKATFCGECGEGL